VFTKKFQQTPKMAITKLLMFTKEKKSSIADTDIAIGVIKLLVGNPYDNKGQCGHDL
jgi:hypothetical protein